LGLLLCSLLCLKRLSNLALPPLLFGSLSREFRVSARSFSPRMLKTFLKFPVLPLRLGNVTLNFFQPRNR